MSDVLLTVSGIIKEDILDEIARGNRPMADYIHMADAFDADLLDVPKAREVGGRFGRLLEKIGGINLLIAWACFVLRKHYKVIFTDGEQIGIPLAIMLKFLGVFDRNQPTHMMIVHILSVGKKMIFFDYLRIHSHIDIFYVYATWQKEFIQDRWGVNPYNVVFTPFMVDDDFFSPSPLYEDIRPKLDLVYPGLPTICAVGLEFRDYPTLVEAVRGLDVQVVIAAGSPWSKRDDTTEHAEIPDNVHVQRFTQHELRALYAYSDFVVMPLYHVEFQAGVTALLEAMSMEKAIVCTSTPGQTDVVVHDENGFYVPPEDPVTLRHAIRYLLNNPDEAQRMGRFGRKKIIEEMSLTQYVKRFDRYVRDAVRAAHGHPRQEALLVNGHPPVVKE